MNKALWLAALAAVAAAGAARSRYERDHFVVEETKIDSEKIREEKTLAFLSDLHDKEFGPGSSLLLEAVAGIHPDLVLIGGDTMIAKNGKADLEVTRRLLEGLVKLCPVYYGNGNHEQRMRTEAAAYGDAYRELVELFSRLGVVYLSNASVNVGEDLTISGLDIEKQYYRDFNPEKMQPEYVARCLGAVDGGRFQILLAHSPLFLDAYAAWGADLTLAGHFHGGTIRLPGLGGVMTPQYQFFLPWCAGFFEKDGKHLLVSRGLGTHSINIRIFNKPQVVVIKLRPAK